MLDFFLLLLKVLVPSLVISWGIKSIAPIFAIAPNNVHALQFVILPPLAIAVWLLWQEWQGRKEV